MQESGIVIKKFNPLYYRYVAIGFLLLAAVFTIVALAGVQGERKKNGMEDEPRKYKERESICDQNSSGCHET